MSGKITHAVILKEFDFMLVKGYRVVRTQVGARIYDKYYSAKDAYHDLSVNNLDDGDYHEYEVVRIEEEDK